MTADLDSDGVLLDSDDLPRLDYVSRFELDTAVGANNTYSRVNTQDDGPAASDTSQAASFEEEYFPYTLLAVPSNPFVDDLNFYFLSARLMEKVGSSFVEVSRQKDDVVFSNGSCLDAPESFTVTQIVNTTNVVVSFLELVMILCQ